MHALCMDKEKAPERDVHGASQLKYGYDHTEKEPYRTFSLIVTILEFRSSVNITFRSFFLIHA